MKHTFENIYCSGNIEFVNEFDVVVTLKINKDVSRGPIRYIAPAPAKYSSSFTGSGLPYASKEQAYDLTPNIGVLNGGDPTKERIFYIKLKRPNSYYHFDTFIQPVVTIMYNEKDSFEIPIYHETIPYRSLGYPLLRKKQKESFYNRRLPIRSQEQIIRDSQYPNHEHTSFWGLKPPK